MDEAGRDGRDGEEAEAIRQLHALDMAVRVRRLAHIVAFDRSEGWRVDGATSMTGWLMFACGQARHSAITEIAVAHALECLPAIAKAAAEGLFSWDQLVALTAIATAATDAELATEAQGWTAGQLHELARAARRRTREEAETADARRYLRWGHHDDGTWRLHGRLGSAEGEVVDAALSQLADSHHKPDHAGHYEPIDARRADALVELASTQLASHSDGDRACIVIHADLDAFHDHDDPTSEAGTSGDTDTTGATGMAGDTGTTAGSATATSAAAGSRTADGMGPSNGSGRFRWAAANFENGPSMATDTLRRLACDCRRQMILEHPDGTPAGIGRTSRQIPPSLSRALRRRDGHCRFPGCDRTRWTHGHHLTHWADGGPTNLDNLSLLCNRHHHLVHENGWTLTGNPAGTLTFTNPYGTTLTSQPTPLRPDIKTRFLGPDPPDPPDP